MSKNNSYKIAIIGPTDTVSGFTALGVESFDATTGEQALEQLKAIKSRNVEDGATPYAIVCIIENLLTDIDQAEYAKVAAGALPAVVVLPGPDGSTGFSTDRLRTLAEKAVGSAII